MCGRYYIEIDEKELLGICEQVQRNTSSMEQISLRMSGEIFPTDVVPVQTGISEYTAMKWGFMGYDSRPLINARSETVLLKPTFRQSMIDNRCIIPASGYYEWKKSGSKKEKYMFFRDGQPLYLAGCFRKEKANPLPSFVILTREAQGELKSIHDRMPVIISRECIGDWFDYGSDVLDLAVTQLHYRTVS